MDSVNFAGSIMYESKIRKIARRSYDVFSRMVHYARNHKRCFRRLEMRDLFVLVVAYFIFDFGLRVGQSYEISSSNHKLQSCLAVVRGPK
jgi:hypothetical protein